MGAIAGAAARILAAAHSGAHLPPEELRRLVNEEVQGLVGSRDRAAASIAIQLRPALTDAFVLTHSASATVREAVLYASPEARHLHRLTRSRKAARSRRSCASRSSLSRLVEDDAAEQAHSNARRSS